MNTYRKKKWVRTEPEKPKETWEHKMIRFPETCKKLIQVAKELNQARDELRKVASDIAGCDLSDWEFKYIERYIDLAINWHYHELVKQPSYQKALADAKAMADAITKVSLEIQSGRSGNFS